MILDYIYPVGTVYYTTNINFRPGATGAILPDNSPRMDWTNDAYSWERINNGDPINRDGETLYGWKRIVNPNFSP